MQKSDKKITIDIAKCEATKQRVLENCCVKLYVYNLVFKEIEYLIKQNFSEKVSRDNKNPVCVIFRHSHCYILLVEFFFSLNQFMSRGELLAALTFSQL